ncbi:MAG: glycosyltransferase family 4 protein [Bacteroidetes bacterium]|nr:glycosyltransferase family 4 protein [Bacteroidota bacterium]
MKVLLYEPTGYGGHALYVKNLSSALSDNGNEIVLLTSNPYSFANERLNYKFVDTLKQMRADLSYLKVRPLWAADRFYRAFYNAYKRNKICSLMKPDIVHLQLTVPLVDQIYVPFLSRKYKTVYTVHNVILHKDTINNRKSFLNRIYQSVNHLIVHTNSNKDQLITEFSISAEKITVIPHGIDPPPVNLENKSNIREKLSISQNTPVVLFFGSIRANKGLDVLLKAMPLVIKSSPKTQLIVAGGMPLGERFDKYERLINELRLKDNVILEVRWIEDHEMELYFQASDIVALPYTSFASQSGVLLQTYKYGKPVVVTDVGGLSETVRDDETGIVVEQSPEVVAASILRLLEDKELYYRYSQNMLNAVLEKYNWDIVAKKTIDIYRKVLNQ